MDPVLTAYATRPTPRYTSYPTAPHFTPAVGAGEYRSWLAAVDPAEPVSLYLHVPYCRRMCWYCGCNMKLAARYEPVGAYVDSLLAEIELVAAILPERLPVARIHWGGGTPTTLRPADLARVMARLRDRFLVAPDAEIAIEADPRTLNPGIIEAIGALGFNRASFGVQEFDAHVQAAINRVQPPDMVAGAVAALRAAGVGRINFDLLYGLPRQTVETLARSIELTAEMRPDRISLFGYAHVPWMAKNQRMIADAELPGATARQAQEAEARRLIVGHGYRAIGLDHFALPDDSLAQAAAAGRLRRNFQGFTDDQAETLIGFGATAIGRTPSGYVQNIAETGAWARAVAAGELPVAKGCAFSADDRLRATVIERLMCDGAVDPDGIGRRFGAAPGWWRDAEAGLRDMADDGLLVLDSAGLRVTERGAPFVRVAAAAFDAYLPARAARHSVAV